MSRPESRSPYAVHPGVEMIRDWIDRLPETTGRSLGEWVALTRASGPPTEQARRDWLKAEHGFGTNAAWWIAERCEGRGAEDDDPGAYLVAAAERVDAMFAGKKAALRPVFDALLEAAKGLGDDVRACPCKTIVPLYRRHVFAQIKPAANTRIDLGLALRDAPAAGRLIDTGGLAKKDRITRRVAVARVEEVDDELRRWLRAAYDLDAPG